MCTALRFRSAPTAASRRRAGGLTVLVGLSLGAESGSARAQDPFEIQVYDGTANSTGVPGLELHLSEWTTGHRTPAGAQAALHGQFHATVEPSIGVRPFWELGAYVQFAIRPDDGAADWAGVKLRSKFMAPPGWDAHWRLGLNLEVSYLPRTYDENRWGSEVRPIVAYRSDVWLVAFNPILDQALASPGGRDGPEFDPAIKVARVIGPVALGFEYYGGLGPIASPLPLRDETHQLFEVVDLVSLGRWEFNAGVGEGLTAASAGIVLKTIVGYSFEPPPTAPARTSRGTDHFGGGMTGGGGGAVTPGGIENSPHAGMRLLTVSSWFQR